MSGAFSIDSSELLLTSHVFGVERRTVLHDGERYERDVVTHPGGVAILAVDAEGRIGVLRQWRSPFDAFLWEIPAGTRDVDGEDELMTAQRELEEELGVRADEWHLLGRFMVSPGWTNQVMTIFEARELSVVERAPMGPEEVNASIHWFTPTEFRELLRAEPAMDSTVTIALHRVFGTFFDD